jgi:hypothetical protein
MRGQSRSKNGIASLTYAPRIRLLRMMDCRIASRRGSPAMTTI